MIKIAMEPCPVFLSESKVLELTTDFISSNKTKKVWGNKSIKDALLKSSNNKCCYCECLLDEESKYMEVEHFKCKKIYPNDVVEWSNLLPSCKRCNGIKKDFDVMVNPIVNPYTDTPANHIKLRGSRFREIDDVGYNTIEAIRLNDFERLSRKRAILISALEDRVYGIYEDMEEYQSSLSGKVKRKIITECSGILSECQPSEAYSCVMATTLVNNPDFIAVISLMKNHSLWDCDMQSLYQNCQAIAVPFCT